VTATRMLSRFWSAGILSCVAAVACSIDETGTLAPPLLEVSSARIASDQDSVVADEYIVTLADSVPAKAFTRAAAFRTLDVRQRWLPHTPSELSSGDEGILAAYTIINGFAARLVPATVDGLRKDPRVASIEPNRIARLAGAGTQLSAPWHLDRIDQRDGTDGSYSWASDGSVGANGRVRIYIVDSGIELSHPEFGGRAAADYSYYGTAGDCNGHGTAVAALAAGQTYGVAKGAAVRSVRVTPTCGGTTTSAALIAAMDWIRTNRVAASVANFSIIVGSSNAVQAALTSLASAAVTPIVAVGDNSGYACSYSPGNSTVGIKVGASDLAGALSSTSNFGSCLDLFAPGVNVTSAGLFGGTSSNSGSSYAAAIVAGIAARFLHDNPTSAAWLVKHYLVSNASPDRISGIWQPETPSLLAFIEPSSAARNVIYAGYFGFGGQQPDVYDSMIAGSVAKGLNLKTFRLGTTGALAGIPISYIAYVNGAWQPRVTGPGYIVPVSNAAITRIRIRFEGFPYPGSICYQVHAANVGWMAMQCDDVVAGDGVNAIQALRVYVPGYSTYGF
jgi:aqualysin 1